MQVFAWLVVLAGLASAKECPPGFSDNGSGSCISQRYGTVSRNAAYKECARDSSYLFQIENAFVNYEVQSLAGSSPEIWLGLTCTSNKTTSCVWDSGRPVNAGDYSNFYGGTPNAEAGACVLMLVANGMWYSVPCTKTTASYGCQYLGDAKVPDCKGDAMYFRGRCYYVPPTTVTSHYDGQVACWNTCGEYASIHSAGENSVVRDLVSVNNSATYGFIGLNSYGSSGNYYWDDSSSYDFNEFGYENYHIGYCVAMAKVDGEVVGNGKWISAQCDSSEAMKIVCKKDLINSCDLEPTTTLVPTMAPTECVSPYFYSGYGYIYSPGFPRGSEANICEYVITEDSGEASITFNELSLDRNSYIYLFNTLFDKNPFVTLSSTTVNRRTYTSSTNVLKVVYNTTGDTSGNYFKATFGGNGDELTTVVAPTTTFDYDQCGGNLWYAGTIRSPIGSNLNCSYQLITADVKTMCIIFDFLNLNSNTLLRIIDDIYTHSKTISNEDVGKMFCAYYYEADMHFTGTSNGDPPVFTARFSDSWLNYTCNGGDFYYSGTITSTNYPQPYPANMDCVYNLYSNKAKITIVFADIYTENGIDYIKVLDGNDGTQLAKIMGGPYTNYTVTSTSNAMKVLLHTDSIIQLPGFTANFFSV